jgi:polyferredoxin
MHGFEQGDLVVRPNWLMAGSMGMLGAILITGFLWVRRSPSISFSGILSHVDLNGQMILLDRLLKWRPLQFICALPVLACFMVVLLAGFFGTKVGGRNIAVMLTWVGWLSLMTLVLVPLAGRIWCLVCPLPLLGEYLQRGATVHVREGRTGHYGNRFFGLGWRWPSRWKGPWLRLIVFLGLGALSATLAGQPLWTSMAILTMVIVAAVMSLVWELRAFCRFLCPVAAYLSAYSTGAPLTVSRRDPKACKQCKQKSCLNGNSHGWACPFGLSVATMRDGSDCGVCTECFKSCPNDNVMLAWRKGPRLTGFSSYGHAWQVIALLVMAAASSLTVHSPWPQVRDMVNVVDKATWPQFTLYAAGLSLLALAVVPGMFWSLSWAGIALSKRMSNRSGQSVPERMAYWRTGELFRSTSPALIPLGMALWMAFFVSTIMTNFTFLLMTLSDPFGWGWDILGTAGMPWVQIWPGAVPWLQAILVLVGLFWGLRSGFGLWIGKTRESRSALWGFVPTAGFMGLFAGGMILYFTNY